MFYSLQFGILKDVRAAFYHAIRLFMQKFFFAIFLIYEKVFLSEISIEFIFSTKSFVDHGSLTFVAYGSLGQNNHVTYRFKHQKASYIPLYILAFSSKLLENSINFILYLISGIAELVCAHERF